MIALCLLALVACWLINAALLGVLKRGGIDLPDRSDGSIWALNLFFPPVTLLVVLTYLIYHGVSGELDWS